MICSVDGCERVHAALGLCRAHYKRYKKYGDPLVTKKMANGTAPAVCTLDGCDRPHHAKGLCSLHFGRLRYHGDPLAGGPERIVGDDERRFWSKVVKGDGCWTWTGYITTSGYGRLVVAGRRVTAHRFAYEALIGPVPPGLDLDHMCHNADASCPGGVRCAHRACVNPAHLLPATRSDNMRRAFARAGVDA